MITIIEKKFNKSVLIPLLSVVVLAVVSCSQKRDVSEHEKDSAVFEPVSIEAPTVLKERYSEKRDLMGTVISLDVCIANNDDEAYQQSIKSAYTMAWQRLEDVAWRMNPLDERSDVARINKAQMFPANVGEDTYYVVERSIYFNQLTQGTFDITVWPLIKLWKESQKRDAVPHLEEIRKIQSIMGVKHLKLLGDYRITRDNPWTMIDLGGIAKGYVIDEVARIFREHGIFDFYIDAGGDLYVGGHNCSDQLWQIGIRHPKDPSQIMDVVAVSDAAITTSGNYERFFEIKGKRYSHIINPVTGYPQVGVISATTIAPTALEADVLSTALCVLGPQEGNRLVDSLGNGYASLIVLPDETQEGDKNAVLKYLSAYFNEYEIKP